MYPTTTYYGTSGPDDHITVGFTFTDTANSQVIAGIFSYDHPIMGGVIYLYQALSLLSCVLSFLLALIVLVIYYVRPDIAKRPSVRLSGWMGMVDMVYSLILFLRYDYDFMSSRSVASIKVIHWLGLALPMTFVFLNASIAFQLHATVILHKERLASMMNYGYEAISFVLGLGLAAFSFKLYPVVTWDAYQTMYTYPRALQKKWYIHVCDYIWEYLAIAYCLFVTSFLLMRLFPMWRSTKNSQMLHPEYNGRDSGSSRFRRGRTSNNNKDMATVVTTDAQVESGTAATLGQTSTNPYQHYDYNANSNFGTSTSTTSLNGVRSSEKKQQCISYCSDQKQKQIRRTIIRILLYPIILILFRLPVIIYTSTNSPYKAIYATCTFAAIQGTINFCVFLLNPGLDEFWPLIFSRLRKKNDNKA